MTGVIDALPGGVQEFAGDVRWIGSATCFSSFPDCFGESERVGQRLLEYRVHKFDDKIERRLIVIVEDDLAVAGRGLGLTHGTLPRGYTGIPYRLSFGGTRGT